MKKTVIALTLAFLLCACSESVSNSSDEAVDNESVLISEEVSDEASNEVNDEVSGNKNETTPFERTFQIELPENTTYSRQVRKDYSDVFEEYFDLVTEKNAVCYAWIEDNELKFGIGKISAISDYGSIKSSLIPATLGELRAILSLRYSLPRRRELSCVTLDDKLNGYTEELEYMLGIGENSIECTICFGNYLFDIPFYGARVNELYSTLELEREEAEVVESGKMPTYNGEDISISVSFAPAGSMDFGGMSEYGNYYFLPNGYFSYYESVYSSTFLSYMTDPDSELYSVMRNLSLSMLKEKGIDYPFVKEDESWCTAQIGLYGNDIVIKGEKVEELRQKVKELSNQALELTENDDSENDVKTAIYIEFYEGMDLKYEFVLYTNDNCIPFRSSSENSKRMLKCENGSYNDLIIYLTDGK